MERNSSISNSDLISRRLIYCVLGLIVLWILYALFASAIANWLGTVLGQRIVSLGEGRIMDPAAFVKHRFTDAAVLITASVVLVLAGIQLQRVICRNIGQPWAWVPVSAAWFSMLNIFLVVAASTGLWWLCLHIAHPNLQLSAFHIERILAEESRAQNRLVVLGSSQGQSEISTGELNQMAKPGFRAANFSYAGATSADFILMREHYKKFNPQVIVVYLSFINTHINETGSRWLPLLSFGGLSYLFDSEIWRLGEAPRLLHGIFGLGIPMIHQSMALQLAALGSISEQGYVRSLDGLPNNTANELKEFQLDTPDVIFLKRILEDFLLEEALADRKIVIIDGQVSPTFSAMVNPAILDDYNEFIDRLEGLHDNIMVLQAELPTHSAEDYYSLDFYHIRSEERTAFTRRLASVLSDRLSLPLHGL